MNIIHSPTQLGAGNCPVCLAIGFFDGVHLGHQQIIRQTVADARQHEGIALIVTFDRHPNTVVAPGSVPPLIYTLPQKLRAIESLGPDALLLLHFDKLFSERPGEVFIRGLARDLGRLQSLCVGTSFTFGHKRSADVGLLKRLGAELGFSVHGMASVSLDGKSVSSTRIREAIRSGDLNLASHMLGRSYSLAGKVVPGDHLGRKMGFPTANLDVTGLALLPSGVYAAQARARGATCHAVVNIGSRPTLQVPQPVLRVEAHLLGVDSDLYGEELEIIFLRKLRGEHKFASLTELQDQIARDVEQVRASF